MLGGVGDRLRRALFGVGLRSTLKAGLWRLGKRDPEANRPAPGPSPFDVAFGVDTGGFLPWRALRSGQRSDAYISGYFGTVPSVGRRLLGSIPDPAGTTFVDLGCGKGRMLILAREAGFGRVIGVEIAPALAAVARANAAAVAARLGPIEIVQADAARFDWPAGPLAVFLYQPFERPVLRAVLERLERSLLAAPRPVVLIYLHPRLARDVDRLSRFERRDTGTLLPDPAERDFSYGGRGEADRYAIWATRAPRPPLLPV